MFIPFLRILVRYLDWRSNFFDTLSLSSILAEWRGPRDAFLSVLDCNIVVSDFKLQLRYCDGKFFKIPKWDFIFARVKTGQVGT